MDAGFGRGRGRTPNYTHLWFGLEQLCSRLLVLPSHTGMLSVPHKQKHTNTYAFLLVCSCHLFWLQRKQDVRQFELRKTLTVSIPHQSLGDNQPTPPSTFLQAEIEGRSPWNLTNPSWWWIINSWRLIWLLVLVQRDESQTSPLEIHLTWYFVPTCPPNPKQKPITLRSCFWPT